MKCADHPGREAVATCASCGKGVCKYCRTAFRGGLYCPSCMEEMLKYPQKAPAAGERGDSEEVGAKAKSKASVKKADRKVFRSMLREGEISVSVVGAESPVVLKRGEKLVVVLPNMSLIEPRSVRKGSAFYGGPSFRVAKGIRLRAGMVKGKGESHEELRTIDQGILTLTSKRLIYSGGKNSRTISLGKIVSIEPFRDGIALRREDRVKTQYFGGINPKTMSIEARIEDRQHKEPFSGKILQYIIEGTIKRYPAKGKRAKEKASTKSTPVSTLSIPDKIKKLAELKDAGILTAEEFEAKKSDLLSRM